MKQKERRGRTTETVHTQVRIQVEAWNSLTNHTQHSEAHTRAHTQEDTKNMAFKCIAARPCDSHGVVSWELPPPLISLMDYNNRKLARPATSHQTTPTDNCCRNINTQAEGTEQPFPHSRRSSISVLKSKFNPCKSVLCGAEESMAMCRQLLASVVSETRCSLALKQGETQAGGGWAFR